MQNIPVYLNIGFIITSVLAVLIFSVAAKNSKIILVILLSWLVLQSTITFTGLYTLTDIVPPPFVLTIVPPLAVITFLFISGKGRQFINSLNIKMLTLLHVIRIPVEFILFGLFVHKAIPKLMTFEGRNFDILAGLTAPVMYYFGFVKKKLSARLILAWNFICLLLLINITVNAILSAPFRFQQLAFDQPNIAILYFPYVWLPCCVVPLVLFSHLVSISKLLKERSGANKVLIRNA